MISDESPEMLRTRIKEVDRQMAMLETRKQMLIDKLRFATGDYDETPDEADLDILSERVIEVVREHESEDDPAYLSGVFGKLTSDGEDPEEVADRIQLLLDEGWLYKPDDVTLRVT